MHLEQFLDFVRPVNSGFAFTDIGLAPGAERLDKHEDIGGSIALVFIVHTSRFSWHGRERCACFLYQLAGLFIHTHQRNVWVIRQTIEFQNVLHTRHELRVLLGRDAPVRAEVRLQFVFFSVLRTVSYEILSTISRRTISWASRCSVQREWPSGASLHPMASRRASFSLFAN